MKQHASKFLAERASGTHRETIAKLMGYNLLTVTHLQLTKPQPDGFRLPNRDSGKRPRFRRYLDNALAFAEPPSH